MIETIKPSSIHLVITSLTGTFIKFASSLTEIYSFTFSFLPASDFSSSLFSSRASLSLRFLFRTIALPGAEISSILSIVFLIASLTSRSSTSNRLTRFFFLASGVSSTLLSTFFFLILGFRFFLVSSSVFPSASDFGLVSSVLAGSFFFLASRSIFPITVNPFALGILFSFSFSSLASEISSVFSSGSSAVCSPTFFMDSICTTSSTAFSVALMIVSASAASV